MNNEYVIFHSRRYGRNYEQKVTLINMYNQLQQENAKLKTDLRDSHLENKRLQKSIAAVRDANQALKDIITNLREELIKIKTIWQ